MITSTVSPRSQITIPKQIRELLKVKEYDKIVFIPVEKGQVLMAGRHKSAGSLFGILKHRKPDKPVSIEEMEKAIQQRNTKRGIY